MPGSPLLMRRRVDLLTGRESLFVFAINGLPFLYKGRDDVVYLLEFPCGKVETIEGVD